MGKTVETEVAEQVNVILAVTHRKDPKYDDIMESLEDVEDVKRLFKVSVPVDLIQENRIKVHAAQRVYTVGVENYDKDSFNKAWAEYCLTNFGKAPAKASKAGYVIAAHKDACMSFVALLKGELKAADITSIRNTVDGEISRSKIVQRNKSQRTKVQKIDTEGNVVSETVETAKHTSGVVETVTSRATVTGIVVTLKTSDGFYKDTLLVSDNGDIAVIGIGDPKGEHLPGSHLESINKSQLKDKKIWKLIEDFKTSGKAKQTFSKSKEDK